MSGQIAFKPIYLPDNRGLGNALREALSHCTYPLVARMDSDDVSVCCRFELQLEQFNKNPGIDIIGGNITEFCDSEDNITGQRTVPATDEAIKRQMKQRCAMNHVAVMYKKEAVQHSGGYLDWPWNEDYYLWIRMIESGCIFKNIPENLVNVRTGPEMSARRGGWKYFKSEKGIQQYMLEHKQIGLFRYLCNIAFRFGGEVLSPNFVRRILFKFIRTSYNKEKNSYKFMNQNISANTKEYPPFSVAMSVYGKDNPEWFDRALESITVEQTVRPSEIVLVVDGPVPDEIQKVIDKYTLLCVGGGITLTIIHIQENKGLGNALKAAVKNSKNELIARMDSDDIAVGDRFEKQLAFFIRHPETDIVGGDIEEFIGDITNIVGKRKVPCMDRQIKEYAKRRCPFNHMTVMYKRSAIDAAGGYQDWLWNEDYYLWLRMLLNKATFSNTGEVLVHARVGREMYQRRGGIRYFKSEISLQNYMLKNRIIPISIYISNCIKRFIVQILLQGRMREYFFRTFARERGN